MNVQISAAVLLIGVPVAKITFRPLFFSKTACVFKNTPCDFLLYDGSTPFTPRCMAVANPRCLYSWLKSKIPDLSHYQNFYEFPIKLLNYLVIICFDP